MAVELKVNVHKRALRAAERVETNGKLHGFLDAEEHLPDQLPLRMRFREYLLKGWDHVVVNKHVDSITMPKWIASSILATVLLFGVSSWWRASDQRDMLIEMRTEQRIVKEAKAAEDVERKAQVAEDKAWREIMHGNQKKIEGMLTQQQIDSLDRIKKSERNSNQ